VVVAAEAVIAAVTKTVALVKIIANPLIARLS